MAPNYMFLLVFSLSSICLQNALASPFSHIMGEVFTKMTECSEEANEKMSPDVCLTQFDSDKNPNDAKFDACNQAMTCAVKKLDYMNDLGQWDHYKLLSIRDKLNDPEEITEFDNSYNLCKNDNGRNSEAVVNLVSCVLKASNKAKEGYDQLKESVLGY